MNNKIDYEIKDEKGTGEITSVQKDFTPNEVYELWRNVPIKDKYEILNEERNISPDAVMWGYKLILGRNPESVDRIETGNSNQLISELAEQMILCNEFKQKYQSHIVSEALSKLDFDIQHNRIPFNTTDDVVIWQSCDREKYWPMLIETQKTIQEYCRRHPVNYEYYIGIKKGFHSIHAAYNRIYKLNELLDAGYKGWFIYMDTDAFICDFDFSFHEYLKDKGNYSMIVTPISDAVPVWNINNGFFIINLAHPVSEYIIRKWKSFYDDKYNEEDYKQADKWDMILNDQTSLHAIIRNNVIEKYLYADGTRKLFNGPNSQIVRQVIRPNHQSNCFDTLLNRIERIAQEVKNILR